MLCAFLIVLACVVVSNAARNASVLLQARDREDSSKSASSPLVCVVVRTYWKHGPGYGDGLQRLLDSLRWQSHTRWEAKLVVMDSRPFTDLADIVQAYDDARISLFASWIGADYRPKKADGTWTNDYHKNLYALTDEAARACSPATTWVIFTNGDNVYHKEAFASLEDQEDADVVAWDFYSRYHRPTGLPCERFQTEAFAPVCKINRMKWCHTDLGAVVYRWALLVKEDLRFGQLRGQFTGEDAAMAELVRQKGWRISYLKGRCLFDQGPSPQMCARLGGVWDERRSNMPDDFGGHCASLAEAAAVNHDPNVELLNISLTHDGALAGFGQGSEARTSILCMRPSRDYRYMMIPPFKVACAEAIDLPLFNEYQESRSLVSQLARLPSLHYALSTSKRVLKPGAAPAGQSHPQKPFVR